MSPHDELPGESEQVLRLVEERAVVRKNAVETSRVSVSTHVTERTEIVHDLLRHDDLVVDRVPMNIAVDEVPPVRQEGDVLVCPIVEEELVITKRLILKEQLRISRRTTTRPIEREVVLRTMNATVERTDAPSPSPSSPSPRQEV